MRVSREVPVGLIPHPNELDRKRIERALISRKHSPSVTPVKAGYLIESPCCSRNIDNDGGQMEVALFHYDAVSGIWKLFFKNHARGSWKFYSIFRRLASAIDELNTDPERLFWQ
ncbi:DUF3024 domain-containing protein [Bradyrhizobium sp. 49]|uniref:DUF3024 domain-containing protein n=1 Tax=unclassified Bradyrhizobium TaxID=2631580 RepID=UPI001FF71A85|nr:MULTISPECIES: DUF3024 domain-containing protein [unclassified Bradyrhizobium]MCK1272196.1 DUF3024 domain-containing protein [Bradyrhizobium sp. 84]MCK1374521.1 DUF3024 domain-containing protein [Bradyrhizobium sp. 49]